MKKIEVRSNTEFSQTLLRMSPKAGFVGHQMGIKKTNKIKKKKGRCLMYLYDR